MVFLVLLRMPISQLFDDEQLEEQSVRMVSYVVIDELLSNMRMIAFVNDVFDIN